MQILQSEGYSTAAKTQPIEAVVDGQVVLACYGEKTIEGQLYKKLIFFATSEDKCISYHSDEDFAIEYATESDISVQDAEHELRDAYVDTTSLQTSVEKVTEYCHGIVPDEL